MNTLNSCNIASPFGEIEECAQFTIDDLAQPFVLHDVMHTGLLYTLAFWIRSDAAGSVKVCDETIATSTEWKQFEAVLTADGNDLDILFRSGGVYYIYKPKLEKGNKSTDWTLAPEDTDKRIDDISADLHRKILEQNTAITQTCEEIILQALTSYTETGDFESFKETTEAQLKLLSDSMTLQFTQATESINAINASLQEQLNTITKYFTFDINGMTIGEVDNPYKVTIDNDRYSMTENGVEVFNVANGKVYSPEMKVTKTFEFLDYLAVKDENGFVSIDYVGGDD